MRTAGVIRETPPMATWAALWGGGFALSAVMAWAGIPFHASLGTFAALIARDLLFAALGFAAWRMLPPLPMARSRLGTILDRGLLAVALTITAIYWMVIARVPHVDSSSPLIFEQLIPRMPVRLLSLVLFQQTVNTCFLLDATRRAFGDRRGLSITIALFSISHLGALALGLPIAWTVALTAAAAIGMAIWGVLRIRHGARLAPVCIHYTCYLAAAVAYALR